MLCSRIYDVTSHHRTNLFVWAMYPFTMKNYCYSLASLASAEAETYFKKSNLRTCKRGFMMNKHNSDKNYGVLLNHLQVSWRSNFWSKYYPSKVAGPCYNSCCFQQKMGSTKLSSIALTFYWGLFWDHLKFCKIQPKIWQCEFLGCILGSPKLNLVAMLVQLAFLTLSGTPLLT